MGLINGSLGQAAYEAYRRWLGLDTAALNGHDRWNGLPLETREAWMNAAIAVKTLVTIEERTPRESENER